MCKRFIAENVCEKMEKELKEVENAVRLQCRSACCGGDWEGKIVDCGTNLRKFW